MKLFSSVIKVALCTALLSTPPALLATPNEKAKPETTIQRETRRQKLMSDMRPLALSYGATTAAWNRHSIGRLSLGFRYLLRDHYLAWLESSRKSSPKKSYDELMNEAIKELKGSTRERPFRLTQQAAPVGILMKEFTNKMKEWTAKQASGRFYKGSRTSTEYAVTACLVQVPKGSTESVLRQTSVECEPEVDAMSQWHENLEGKSKASLMVKMKTYTAMFMSFMETGLNFPLYREMVQNRSAFKAHLTTMFDAGLKPETISENLYRSGVYFEVVHNKLRYHYKRREHGIPSPELKK
ncbi:hypothetical protein [Sansalvadorimonas verongulae]|uniref:hypothetical protein n=1 Tax=Sansalvadorimonas verongulae TaxID=2172824 RepID=UPI0012BC4570|nr:hypothetical protein [Sansalvadorimonas verongulae]MTI12083.1 hypothetical protein [Sansalvadorimonas verongulae]